MLLLVLSFVAGMLTVLAPCILPLLPVIIGGSLSGGSKHKSRPYIITGSLILSLVLFTVLLKVSTSLGNINPKVWVIISGSLIILLGLVSLFPNIWEQLVGRIGLQARSQKFLGIGTRNRNIFIGPILIGVALGPVFSSCSPTYAFILATVLPRNFISGLGYITAYCVGLGLVLLFIAVTGQRFISRFSWAINPLSIFRRCLGVIFIIVGILIIFGWDKKIETYFTNHSLINSTNFEQKLFDNSRAKDSSLGLGSNILDDQSVLNVKAVPAPELVGLNSWINSPPLNIADLKGKVVLIDFWTYSCINCLRTLPFVENWYQTYKDQGLVVIGVHAPEFSFERVSTNVQKAVKDQHLTYPVALDNNLDTWNAYSNQYWPAHYLIDKQGNIRQVHFGEGKYSETEKAIQLLLGAKNPITSPADPNNYDSSISPETYLGIARASGFSSSDKLAEGSHKFPSIKSLKTNQWSLEGDWIVTNENITSNSGSSSLRYSALAKDVYLVVSSSSNETIQVSIDGQPATVAGESLNAGKLILDGPRLYHVAHFDSIKNAQINFTIPSGVSLNAFTFGG